VLTAEGWLLVSLTLVGAAFLVAHVVVVWLSLGATDMKWRWRVLALLPPVAPALAWIAGRRVAPIAWGALLGSYVVLRLFS
jgi:hypothetical protein